MSEAFEIQRAEAPASASAPRRKSSVSLIVLHDDARPADAARAAFIAKAAKSAPHYYVAESGAIVQFVGGERAARHSGTASWNKRRRNIDRISIGIAIEHTEGRPYPDAQLVALHRLIDAVQKRYKLNDAAIAGWTPGGKSGTGTLAGLVPPPPPMAVPAVPIGPMVLGEEAPDYGLWAFLQGETYRQRGGGLKYTLNDLAHSQAFPVYALKFDLGAPVGPNQPTPLVVDGVAYNFQVFARNTIFNAGREYTAVQSLNSLFENAIPAGGLARALLEASYGSSIATAESVLGRTLTHTKTLRPDWRFHYVALRERFGPPLSDNYVTDDGQWAVQVFPGDTLYTPMSDQAGCQLLSQADPSAPEYQLMWTETYKFIKVPFDPNSPFHQRAIQLDIGTPLTGVSTAQYGGANYQIQVYAHDTLYAGPDGTIKRMSELPKPPDVLAWQPAKPSAAAPTPPPPPPTPTPQTPVVITGGAPVAGDVHWPPPPNFWPQPNNEARFSTFGRFDFQRTSGDNIRILGSWEQDNIISVSIPQLANVQGAGGGNIRLHKLAADQLRAIFAAWQAAGLLDRILSWSGSYVPRFMRSGKQLSTHAFGCAFDINVPWNGYYKRAALVGEKGCVRELVPLANQHGFYWGGHFKYGGDLSDGMHFEWARPV
jgi:hypothetical protein